MSFELWLAFVATSAVILVIPGPTILTVVSYSLAHGRRAFIPILVAVVLGDSSAILLSLLGLGVLLAASALLFAVVKWVGGLYLIYLGIKLLSIRASPNETAKFDSASSGWNLFARMYPVAFLNPKGIVFYVAFFPQFISAGDSAAAQLSVLAVTFIVLGIVSVTLYSLFAASCRRVLSRPGMRRGFNVLGGSLLSAAGAYELLARRPA
jgi:homoserine/homoserine lactone efflux protein